jgi:lysozyme
MINTIIDTYHGNSIDFAEVQAGGIIAVIHKATQGTHFRDSKYHERKQEAKALGLLWGAYHFSTGAPVTDQVENFLSFAKPENDELIALDWEPSDGPDMTLQQARDFVMMIKNETGRFPVIYGGHLLRESVGHGADPVLKNCPLWYARYSSAPIGIPVHTWPTFTLWQYTDGVNGREPRETPGVSGADRNAFHGTEEELRALWPFTKAEEDVILGAGFATILNS